MNKEILMHIFIIIMLFVSSIILFSKAAAQTANNRSKGNIIVEMTNFKNNNGYALIALYNSAKGFPSKEDGMIRSVRGTIINNKSIVQFKNVPYGIYAVSLYHDANENGKFDTTFFFIPKEGIGASNNAKGRFGPPKFDDAKFELKSTDLKLSIKVIYH